MDLAPVRDLCVFGRRQTAADSMAAHFINVGQAIAAASQAYQEDTDAVTVKKPNNSMSETAAKVAAKPNCGLLNAF